jgi:chromosome segregation ATPase
MWRNIKFISLLVLFALLLVTVSASCQAEDSYRLYESELTRLTQIIDNLESNWNQAKSSLQSSKQQLQQQEKQLIELQTQLQTLKNQIVESENLSIQLSEKLSQAEMSLKTLEESFKQYKSEAESRIRKLTIQRNVLAVIAGILGVLWAIP